MLGHLGMISPTYLWYAQTYLWYALIFSNGLYKSTHITSQGAPLWFSRWFEATGPSATRASNASNSSIHQFSEGNQWVFWIIPILRHTLFSAILQFNWCFRLLQYMWCFQISAPKMWRKLDEVSDSWNHRRIVAPFLDGEKTLGLEKKHLATTKHPKKIVSRLRTLVTT